MKFGNSLFIKIILLAFLNVALLVCVLAAFARIQYQVDLGSLLLSPTRDRILSVSRLIALELPNKPQSEWSQLLESASASYPAKFYLFDGWGNQLAGKAIVPPAVMTDFIHDEAKHHRRQEPPPMKPPDMKPPEMFAAFKTAGLYWVGARIPIWQDPGRRPLHGVLLWTFPSLWTNLFFFDYRPWLLVLLAVILVSLICWVPFIRGLTRSISAMTKATGQIAEGHFEIALSTKRRDELGRLSQAINRMAERLSSYVHGQKRFLSDVAHELCSPVARAQMALGILQQRANDDSLSYVQDLDEEVEHMSGLINQLLSFSKAQISSPAKQLTRVSVADTVSNVLERESFDSVSIQTKVDSSIEVIAEPDYLFRSLANLVRNAIRYAGDAGPIEISALNKGENIAIIVADHGPGVPESEIEEIFKPFYRPEFARQRETGGTGLGLAIVKSCIEACGGIVHCHNRVPHGLQVEIHLPAAARS